MSRFLKSLSSLMNGSADRSRRRAAADTRSDAGPSTLTTPLFPIDGAESDTPAAPQAPARRSDGASDTPPAAAQAAPSGALVPLAAGPATHKSARRSTSSRALKAAVRATTQVSLPTHVEPTPAPKVGRLAHRSAVVLTETERLRLQIMQVQLKLTGLGLYEGPIDGLMNPDLADGVRHFQTLKGMRDSGLLTAGTLAALGIRAAD